MMGLPSTGATYHEVDRLAASHTPVPQGSLGIPLG